MRKIPILLTVLMMLAFVGSAQTVEEENSSVAPGLTPASFFYPAEIFVENLEVKLAGVIGGPDLKSKALANNAEERIAEANKLLDMNRSKKATEAIQKYSKTMNKSKELASRGQDRELQQKLDNISNKNTEKLREVKKRVPSQAKEAIEKAITRSQKPAAPGKPGNNSSRPGKSDTGKDVPGRDKPGNKSNLTESGGSNISISPKESSSAAEEDNTVQEFSGEDTVRSIEGSTESSDKGKITENKSMTGLR